MKIESIERVRFKGKVYNLELTSNNPNDDLFWLEGISGVVTHNCFPKDVKALITVAKDLDIIPLMLSATDFKNNNVRKNRDWEHMKGRAVT